MRDATEDREVVNTGMEGLSTDATDLINTAAADESCGRQAPAISGVGDDGGWKFNATGVQPTFDPTDYWPDDTDSDEDGGSDEEDRASSLCHGEWEGHE